jgi:hypothetical protein
VYVTLVGFGFNSICTCIVLELYKFPTGGAVNLLLVIAGRGAECRWAFKHVDVYLAECTC